jgi:hypothetical protein
MMVSCDDWTDQGFSGVDAARCAALAARCLEKALESLRAPQRID